jgi:energy-converting hydrogenase Eha subunit C
VPIIAGLDKFTNLLTNWEQYLNPALAQTLPFSAHTFMLIVGVVEIIAGVIVLWKPAIGGYIVMAWLACIGLSLLAAKEYLDVAVRDLVMAVGAYSFAQIARTVRVSKDQHATNTEVAWSHG